MADPGKSRVLNDGDWICEDPECANLNFARRSSCNRCGKDKVEASSTSKKHVGIEIGKAAADKSRGLFSADDWQCSKCGNVNWARRQQCNMCNAPKFGDVEERTGYGGGVDRRIWSMQQCDAGQSQAQKNNALYEKRGPSVKPTGYNDRGVVEYVDRDDSDDEYDEFGRKKKRFRKLSRSDDEETEFSEEAKCRPPKANACNDTSKDDDEEDDDEDGDLSKYDLSDWGDEECKTKCGSTSNQKENALITSRNQQS